MNFESILFLHTEDQDTHVSIEPPTHFGDLNLDQVIAAITENKKGYDLKQFFHKNLQDEQTIQYRQNVMRDLEYDDLYQAINTFAEKMVIVRRYVEMIKKLNFARHKQGWHLEAAIEYSEAITTLDKDLDELPLNSEGFTQFREYLRKYVRSESYRTLETDAQRMKAGLVSIRFSVIIRGNWVRVRKYEGEIDYSQEVDKTFEKFKQGAAKSYLVDSKLASGMNHIEAQILDCVAKLFPDEFKALEKFCEVHYLFMNAMIERFDREVQFYVAYRDFIARIKEKGLAFCYPKVSNYSKEVFAKRTFDIALANARMYDNTPIVDNDFHMKNPERIFVISGPNQGGKTTFARMFGQVHYLASLGLPVPGAEAQLFLFDQIYTHFEKEENIRNLRGKLQDDLVRIRTILEQATGDSIIIMNEIFTSTTLKDAIFLSKQIMEKISVLDALCVIVSFVDELSVLNEKTVSMVSTILPGDPTSRTYKIIRKPADGLSFAASIAEKHNLTYDGLLGRIP